jgi:hypothetical protein
VADPGHEKYFKRLVQLFCFKKSKGLKTEAQKDEVWKIVANSDTSYAGDKDERKRKIGYIILT